MDYEDWKTVVLLGNTVVMVIIAIVQWIDRKAGAPVKLITDLKTDVHKRMDQFEERLDEKVERLSQVERDIKELPNRSEVVRIHERIDQLIDDYNQNSRANNLLLGEISGQLKQLAKEHK